MAHAAAQQRSSEAGAEDYRRRQPEQTALHQTLTEYWPAFVERVEQSGGSLPGFVVREVEGYLRCGILRFGFVQLACTSCGFERLVGFSCKRRGFCPSCLGRRMNDSAVHLVERVLPEVRIRQWVCSLPHRLRYMLGYDAKLCSEVLGAFVETVAQLYRRKAKREFGLRSVHDAQTGAVTFVQRFDSALRLNVHAHTLSLDGVYVIDEQSGKPTFHSLGEPTEAELRWVAARTRKRAKRILARHGRSLEPGEQDDTSTDPLSTEQPVLAACYGASVQGLDVLGPRAGQPTLRQVDPVAASPSPPPSGTGPPGAVSVEGFNVQARVGIDGRDRKRLERICRYIARPPIAQDRLERLPDGRLRYTMKKPWKDGTRALVFEPLDFIARLCALIPAPRVHMLRYHGVLAPGSLLRSRIVPAAPPPAADDMALQLSLFEPSTPLPIAGGRPPLDAPVTGGRRRWAWLLRHVFEADLTVCARCGAAVQLEAVATCAAAIKRILTRHGLAERARPPPPIRSLGQLELPVQRP